VSSTAYNVRVAFQLYIRPTTFGIGKETVRASGVIDSTGTYGNHEVEWYTSGTETGAIFLTGLLVQCMPVTGTAGTVGL
jgi:hypothetical protein